MLIIEHYHRTNAIDGSSCYRENGNTIINEMVRGLLVNIILSNLRSDWKPIARYKKKNRIS